MHTMDFGVIIGLIVLTLMLSNEFKEYKGNRWLLGISFYLILLLYVFVARDLFINEYERDVVFNEYKLDNARLAYFANDGGGSLGSHERGAFLEFLSENELDMIYVVDRVANYDALELDSKAVEPTSEMVSDYEALVNMMIEDADPSEDKEVFKEYVIEQSQMDLGDVWVDYKLSDYEAELLRFVGEALDRDMEPLIADLASGEEYRNGFKEYNEVLGELREKYDRVDVADVKVLGKSADGMYKVDK